MYLLNLARSWRDWFRWLSWLWVTHDAKKPKEASGPLSGTGQLDCASLEICLLPSEVTTRIDQRAIGDLAIDEILVVKKDSLSSYRLILDGLHTSTSTDVGIVELPGRYSSTTRNALVI